MKYVILALIALILGVIALGLVMDAEDQSQVLFEKVTLQEAVGSSEVLGKDQVLAPDLLGLTNWINSEEISSLSELHGKVVLVDFWTYSCINCIRTLPHVQALYEKYGEDGFVVLGLHAPEFSYEHKVENVRAAVIKHGLTYPIAQDNDFKTWRNYENRYWPAHYLIDKDGVVRYTHFGEGKYEEMDDWVGRLLGE